ncbi:hypothetical protein ABTU92_29520, partial [Rhodoplanes sp. SY1]
AFTTQFSDMEELTLATLGGNDTVTIVAAPPAIVRSTTVETGDGDDSVVVDAYGTDTVIDLGGGDDTLSLRATTAGETITVRGGTGDDIIAVETTGTDATTLVYGDAGRDLIKVFSVGAASTTEIWGDDGRYTIDDPDTVVISGAGIPDGATVTAHGENPNPPDGSPGDTLIFDPGTLGYTPSITNQRFGTIKANGRGTVTYDTFEGVGVLTGPFVTIRSIATIREGDGVTVLVDIQPNGAGGTLDGDVVFDIDGDGVYGEAIGTLVATSG